MCFSFYLIADRPFYKIYQAGVFPKFGVTLPLSITTSSSLGRSWSTQCSVNLATHSVQYLLQAYLQLEFRFYLVLYKYCMFYPGCHMCAVCQSTGSICTLRTFTKFDIYQAEYLKWIKLVNSLYSKYCFTFLLGSVL